MTYFPSLNADHIRDPLPINVPQAGTQNPVWDLSHPLKPTNTREPALPHLL